MLSTLSPIFDLQKPEGFDEVRWQQLVGFYERFSMEPPYETEGHFLLLCQAAFPAVLTPDLLYRLWVNFQFVRDEDGKKRVFPIPREAVSDILLQQSLLREVGPERYELLPDVRNYLTQLLYEAPLLGKVRVHALAQFLKDYVDLHLQQVDDFRLAKIQRLTAEAFLSPQRAAEQLTTALNEYAQAQSTHSGAHLTQLINSLAIHIQGFDYLKQYAQGLAAHLAGDAAGAREHLQRLPIEADQISLPEGMHLTLPAILQQYLGQSHEEIGEQPTLESAAQTYQGLLQEVEELAKAGKARHALNLLLEKVKETGHLSEENAVRFLVNRTDLEAAASQLAQGSIQQQEWERLLSAISYDIRLFCAAELRGEAAPTFDIAFDPEGLAILDLYLEINPGIYQNLLDRLHIDQLQPLADWLFHLRSEETHRQLSIDLQRTGLMYEEGQLGLPDYVVQRNLLRQQMWEEIVHIFWEAESSDSQASAEGSREDPVGIVSVALGHILTEDNLPESVATLRTLIGQMGAFDDDSQVIHLFQARVHFQSQLEQVQLNRLAEFPEETFIARNNLRQNLLAFIFDLLVPKFEINQLSYPLDTQHDALPALRNTISEDLHALKRFCNTPLRYSYLSQVIYWIGYYENLTSWYVEMIEQDVKETGFYDYLQDRLIEEIQNLHHELSELGPDLSRWQALGMEQAPRTLLIEDRKKELSKYEGILTNFGISELRSATSGEAALELLPSFQPELVITNVGLQKGRGSLDGIQTAHEIIAQQPARLIFLSRGIEKFRSQIVREFPDAQLLKRPANPDQLWEAIEACFQDVPEIEHQSVRWQNLGLTAPPRTLLLEDEHDELKTYTDTLYRLGVSAVLALRSGEEALEQAADFSPELIITNIDLSGGGGNLNGIDTAATLLQTYDAKVIILSRIIDYYQTQIQETIPQAILLTRPATQDQLWEAIGQCYAQPSIPSLPHLDQIDSLESKVLDLLSEGDLHTAMIRVDSFLADSPLAEENGPYQRSYRDVLQELREILNRLQEQLDEEVISPTTYHDDKAKVEADFQELLEYIVYDYREVLEQQAFVLTGNISQLTYEAFGGSSTVISPETLIYHDPFKNYQFQELVAALEMHSLVMVTGPTGSRKMRWLYTALQQVHQEQTPPANVVIPNPDIPLKNLLRAFEALPIGTFICLTYFREMMDRIAHHHQEMAEFLGEAIQLGHKIALIATPEQQVHKLADYLEQSFFAVDVSLRVGHMIWTEMDTPADITEGDQYVVLRSVGNDHLNSTRFILYQEEVEGRYNLYTLPEQTLIPVLIIHEPEKDTYIWPVSLRLAETSLWKQIQDDADAELRDRYLTFFPNGRFASQVLALKDPIPPMLLRHANRITDQQIWSCGREEQVEAYLLGYEEQSELQFFLIEGLPTDYPEGLYHVLGGLSESQSTSFPKGIKGGFEEEISSKHQILSPIKLPKDSQPDYIRPAFLRALSEALNLNINTFPADLTLSHLIWEILHAYGDNLPDTFFIALEISTSLYGSIEEEFLTNLLHDYGWDEIVGAPYRTHFFLIVVDDLAHPDQAASEFSLASQELLNAYSEYLTALPRLAPISRVKVMDWASQYLDPIHPVIAHLLEQHFPPTYQSYPGEEVYRNLRKIVDLIQALGK